VWKLGSHRLDPTAFTLECEGEPVALARRPFDLLLYLVVHRERVVSREELLREVWGGVAVVDGAVSTAVYELRAALGDPARPREERWIETVRGRGFRFRGPVKELDAPARLAPGDPSPFVGRGRALSTLRGRVADAAAGRGSALVVQGRAGMGKTRLVQELAGGLGEARLAAVQCEEGAPPLWPWSELMRGLADGEDRASAAGFEQAEDAVGPGDPGLHFQRIAALHRCLEQASRARPLVLVIEDLHWADPSSLALLDAVSRKLGSLPVLLVATERSEADADGALRDGVEPLDVERLRLEPLSVLSLYGLVEALLHRVPSPELVGWIHRHGQGVPLMVRELTERIAEEGESLVDVPRIAQRLFARRFEALDPPTREALGVASLCGVRFDAPLVEAAAGEALGSDRAWIREGLRAGVLVAVGEHPLRFAFRHALLRDAAEGLLAATDVPGWHGRIADALERQRPDPKGAALSRLARHSAASAVERPDVEAPLRYGLLAARRAAGVLDWAEVASHASHVLGWIEFRPAGPERDAQEIEAALLRCAAIAYASGHVEETASLLERVAPLLERSADPRQRVLAEAFAMANARCAGDYAPARALAERASAVPGLEEVAACWRVVAASLAGELDAATQEPDWGDALPGEPRFHEFARLCGRDPGIDRLGLSAFAFWARGRDALAVSRAERAVTWAEDSGDARGRIWALFLLCTLHELRRDWGEVQRRAQEIDAASARGGVDSWLGFGSGMRLWAEARSRQQHGRSLGPLAAVLRDRARSSSTSLKSPLLLLASRVFEGCGDLEGAEGAARDAVAWSERSEERFLAPELHRQLGHVLGRRDDAPAGAASASLRRAVEIARAQGHVVGELRGLADLAAAGEATGAESERLRALRDAHAATLGPRERAAADATLAGRG